jgi:hypothetical protein
MDCESKCVERGSEPSLGRGNKYPVSLFISNYPGKYQDIVLKEATTHFLLNHYLISHVFTLLWKSNAMGLF